LSPSRDQQIRAIYRAALERPLAERWGFVVEITGGDDELLRSVQELLSSQDPTVLGAEADRTENGFAAGTRFGSYRIDGMLGSGGMGVVYRATDTKLHRPVAIKFLSGHTADAAAKRRFQQEASTASSLNHPHIVTVYDVGEHDGRQYIVSELIDGGTLHSWLASAPRGWRARVELLTGVADAVAAAHTAGVLHRDIKPGNVLVGTNGYAKLTDFGLAKLLEERSLGAVARGDGARNTRSGVVIGTVAYMSPEQACGQPLDERSDIFSFGVLLYEALAGRLPFAATNDLEVLTSIVHLEHAPLPDGIPELLRMAVDKALEKEPGDRYQTARELVVDLKRVLQRRSTAPSSRPSVGPLSDAQAVSALVRHDRRKLMAAGTTAALLALAGGAYFVMSALGPSSGPSRAADDWRGYEITQLTTTGNAITPAISPDGRYVFYVRQEALEPPTTSLWVRQIATSSNRPIVPAEPGLMLHSPTVTPDGEFVDFVRFEAGGQYGLWRVPSLGGTPRRLLGDVRSPVGWSPDGRRMAFVRGDTDGRTSSLVIASEDGSGERVITTRRIPKYFVNLNISTRPGARPVWSPDGRTLALFELDPGGTVNSRVVFVDVETGAETIRDSQASTFPQGIAWLGSTSLALSQPAERRQRAQLWRMSYPDGTVSQLTNDLLSYVGLDVDGERNRLVTSRRETRTSVWVGDAGGSNSAELVAPFPLGGNSLAWGGDRVVYDTNLNGRSVIVGVMPGRDPPEEIVSGAFVAATTSSGDTVVFARTGRALDGLWRSVRGQPAVQLVASDAYGPVVTPDDRYVVFGSSRGGIQSPWIAPIEGGEPREITRAFVSALSLDVSPDGRRLVFWTAADDRAETIAVCDFPDCANRRDFPLPSNLPDLPLHWTPDGAAIAYVERSGTNIWALPLDGGPPRPLTQFSDSSAGAIVRFAWSRDGTRLALLRSTTTEDIVLLRRPQL